MILVLQVLQTCAHTTFFLRLLRTHLLALGPRQLENQFTRICQAVLGVNAVDEAVEAICRRVKGKDDLTGLAEETLQYRQQIDIAMTSISWMSSRTTDGNASKSSLGLSVSRPWQSIIRIVTQTDTAGDYRALARFLFECYGCDNICRQGSLCAEMVSDVAGTAALIDQLNSKMLCRPPLEQSLDLGCLAARQEVILTIVSILRVSADKRRHTLQRRALTSVRDLLEFARCLSEVGQKACNIQSEEQLGDWLSIDAELASCGTGLLAVNLSPFFSAGDAQLSIDRLTRASSITKTLRGILPR